MARGEHDRPDPTLIVEGSRRALPSKRVQGDDYPITPLEELRTRDRGKASVNREPEDEATYLKDASKPDGEACRDDGTLKDAHEIEWLHSPSQSHPIIRGEKRKQDGDDSDSMIDELPKSKVSMTF